jgi:YVTN family beta-propeller protein
VRPPDRGRRRAWSRRTAALALSFAASTLPAGALAGPPAFVANHGDGTVSVLDTASNVVVATVTVGSEPAGAAVAPSGARAYVTNQAATGTVSVIDTAVNGVVATVTVGARASGVAVKLPGNRAYVTNRDDKNVSVIDTATNGIVATVTVGNNPLGVAIDPAGSPAYVVNKGGNSVSVIDTNENAVIATIPVGNDPTNVAVSPNGRRVYVTNGSNASVSVIDTGFNSVIATVPVGNIPEGIAVAPSGAAVYVANSGPNSVSVIDTATNAVTATIPVGTTPSEIAFRPDGARVFVVNRQGGTVSVIETATNTVAGTVAVGFGPTGLGHFVAPALELPRFSKAARKCQSAVARQGVKLAQLEHALEVTCRLAIIKAEIAGGGTAAAEAKCALALDVDNPASKLARARGKLAIAVARACRAVAPSALNAPCARGAATFGDTSSCLVDQHAARIAGIVGDEFSATRPAPLGAAAVACQAALAKNGRRFADRLHKDLAACLEKLLAAAGNPKTEAKAVAGCRAKLDLGSVLTKASSARGAAAIAIAAKCAGVTPADLGAPCDPAAPNLAATAGCVLDHHVTDVARLVAGAFNDACVMLTRIGLGTAYPGACRGTREAP